MVTVAEAQARQEAIMDRLRSGTVHATPSPTPTKPTGGSSLPSPTGGGGNLVIDPKRIWDEAVEQSRTREQPVTVVPEEFRGVAPGVIAGAGVTDRDTRVADDVGIVTGFATSAKIVPWQEGELERLGLAEATKIPSSTPIPTGGISWPQIASVAPSIPQVSGIESAWTEAKPFLYGLLAVLGLSAVAKIVR